MKYLTFLLSIISFLAVFVAAFDEKISTNVAGDINSAGINESELNESSDGGGVHSERNLSWESSPSSYSGPSYSGPSYSSSSDSNYYYYLWKGQEGSLWRIWLWRRKKW